MKNKPVRLAVAALITVLSVLGSQPGRCSRRVRPPRAPDVLVLLTHQLKSGDLRAVWDTRPSSGMPWDWYGSLVRLARNCHRVLLEASTRPDD